MGSWGGNCHRNSYPGCSPPPETLTFIYERQPLRGRGEGIATGIVVQAVLLLQKLAERLRLLALQGAQRGHVCGVASAELGAVLERKKQYVFFLFGSTLKKKQYVFFNFLGIWDHSEKKNKFFYLISLEFGSILKKKIISFF